jgi:hypothetical protein
MALSIYHGAQHKSTGATVAKGSRKSLKKKASAGGRMGRCVRIIQAVHHVSGAPAITERMLTSCLSRTPRADVLPLCGIAS